MKPRVDIEEEHGGGCCGVFHIYNFEGLFPHEWGEPQHIPTKDEIKKIIQYRMEDIYPSKYEYATGDEEDYEYIVERGGFLAEVFLNEHQEKSWPQLVEALLEMGFEKVKTFTNANTLNKVSMYIHTDS